jgi:dihydrofolate reductase/metal-sulfur cluster biosynthetic enzyme
MLVAIWAQDKNNLIGQNNKLPWHLPEDLRRFKELTQHNILVMGRKTYEGMGKKPLPNRQTIVLTRDVNYDPGDQDVLVMNSVEEVLNYAKKVEGEKVVYIVGGAQLYKEFEPYFDQLLRTIIHHSFAGDAYFPEFNYSVFQKVEAEMGIKNEKNPYDYEFETFIRKGKTSGKKTKKDLKELTEEEIEKVKDKILTALELVIDPELGIDIVNLGLIYEVKFESDGKTTIKMTLTTMGCPMADVLTDQIHEVLEELVEVHKVEVQLVWQPAWTTQRMSRYARIALGIR